MLFGSRPRANQLAFTSFSIMHSISLACWFPATGTGCSKSQKARMPPENVDWRNVGLRFLGSLLVSSRTPSRSLGQS